MSTELMMSLNFFFWLIELSFVIQKTVYLGGIFILQVTQAIYSINYIIITKRNSEWKVPPAKMGQLKCLYR